MTPTQVQYAQHLENVKHNRADESIRSRQASAQELQASVASSGLGETRRHNQAQEMVNWFTATHQAEAQGKQADAAMQQAGAATSRAVSEQQRVGVLQQQANETARHDRQQERYYAGKLSADLLTSVVRGATLAWGG